LNFLSPYLVSENGSPSEIDYAFIDYAPSDQDVISEKIMSGREGALLFSQLKDVGINNYYITSFFKYISSASDNLGKVKFRYQRDVLPYLEDPQVKMAIDLLRQEIFQFKFKVIFTLGQRAFELITGKKLNVKYKENGYKLEIARKLDNEKIEYFEVLVFPLYSYKSVFISGRYYLDENLYSLININSRYHPPVKQELDYKILNTVNEVRDYFEWLVSNYKSNPDFYITYDIETNCLSPFDKGAIIGNTCFSHTVNQGYMILIDHIDSKWSLPERDEIIKLHQELFASDIKVVNQNITFDYQWSRKHLNIPYFNVYGDTMLASFALYGDKISHSLDFLVTTFLKVPSHKNLIYEYFESIKKPVNHNECPLSILLSYACQDTDRTMQLAILFHNDLKRLNLFDSYQSLICEEIQFITDMQYNGNYIDLSRRESIITKLEEDINTSVSALDNNPFIILAKKQFTGNPIYTGWPFLRFIFRNILGLVPVPDHDDVGTDKYTVRYYVYCLKNDTFNCDSDSPAYKLVWDKTGREWREMVLDMFTNLQVFKSAQKLLTSYAIPIQNFIGVDGCVHPSYRPTTATARLACIHGDTKISLLNGTEVPISDLVKDQEYWVYGCDENKEIIPVKVKALGITKTDNEYYEVTLDNDETIKCTIEEQFMMRDGSYRFVNQLVEGDSLMPLYRKENEKGYELYQDNSDSVWYATHLLVGIVANRYQIKDVWNDIHTHNKPDRYLINHHKDFNKRNNEPPNLEWQGEHDHLEYHINLRLNDPKHADDFAKMVKELWEDPEYIRAASERSRQTMLRNHKDPEFLKRKSERSSKSMYALLDKNWNDPEYIERHKKRMYPIMTATTNKLWKDQSFRYKMKIVATTNMTDLNKSGKINKGKVFSIFNKLISLGLEINEKNYNDNSPRYPYILTVFDSYEQAINEYNIITGKDIRWNHRIKSIRLIKSDELVNFYDLQSPKTSNFALSSGIFVHNCSDPSLHTIKWGSIIKGYFTSRFKNGLILLNDFSQMELRVVTMLCKDPTMAKSFNDGKDIHDEMTRVIYEMTPEQPMNDIWRRNVKTVVFGTIYLKTAWSLAKDLEVTKAEAEGYQKKIMENAPNLPSWIDKSLKVLESGDRFVYTVTGRRLPLFDDYQDFYVDFHIKSEKINWQIQSAASDLTLMAGARMSKAMKTDKLQSVMVGMVHDSLMADVHPREIIPMLKFSKLHMIDRVYDPEVVTLYETSCLTDGKPSILTDPFKVKIKVDFGMGCSWDEECNVGLNDLDQIVFKGKLDHIKGIMQNLLEEDYKLVSLEEIPNIDLSKVKYQLILSYETN